ncbi:MAG: hypothetical protein SynsKO_20400 [Synoicihabitans sp.]
MKMAHLNLRSTWPGAVVLTSALIFFGWAALRGWNYPPTDSHASRQTQTAITAELLHENGFSPLTPFNGLGAPWNVPMEFPTYQVITAGLAHFTYGDIIAAGRLTALLGALLIIPSFWMLLRRSGLDPNERCFAIALLFSAPLWVHFSRSILIETWAIGLTLLWLAIFVEILFRSKVAYSWIAGAITLGILSALTKVTTFAIALPIATVLTLVRWQSFGKGVLLRAGVVTIPGVIAALLWTRFGDAIKTDHPYAGFLTSQNLSAWNWGTWEQRLDPQWWQRWGEHVQLLFPAGSIVLILIGLWRGDRRIRWGIGLATLGAVVGPLAFANLYYVHNYYSMAVAPMIAAAMGIAVTGIWRTTQNVKWRQIMGVGLLLSLGAWQAHAYLDGLGRGQVRNRPLPSFGDVLREISRPDDNIVIIGQEWDPILTYTIDRPVAFIRETYETDEDAWQFSRKAMGAEDFTLLVAVDSVAGDLRFVHHRCRELGLSTVPLFSTDRADIYVADSRREQLQPTVQRLLDDGRILANRPNRMGPGESRIEFITANWRPLEFSEARGMFDQCSPYPSAVFTHHAPAQLQADGRDVLHIHPPGGLRFSATSFPRRVEMDYGIRPEIWRDQLESDGVRFQFLVRGPDERLRPLWSDFVQPLSNPEDQRLLHTELTLPAHHELELWIDAGPDHNPGYDWSIIGSLRVR